VTAISEALESSLLPIAAQSRAVYLIAAAC
jgi:hypothetical protein